MKMNFYLNSAITTFLMTAGMASAQAAAAVSTPAPPVNHALASDFMKNENATYQVLITTKSEDNPNDLMVFCRDGILKNDMKVNTVAGYQYISKVDVNYKDASGKYIATGTFQVEVHPDGKAATFSMWGYYFPTPDAGFPIAATALYDIAHIDSNLTASGSINADGTLGIDFKTDTVKPRYSISLSINRGVDCEHDLRNPNHK